MKKSLFTLLAVLVLTSLVLSACGGAAPAAPTAAPAAPTQAPAEPTKAPAAPTVSPEEPAKATEAPAATEYKPATDKPKKIAFFVSDLSNVFHQGQATEAQKYAKEKYGAEVVSIDGKSDSATMTANVDKGVAQ